jgi:hypothetical protein
MVGVSRSCGASASGGGLGHGGAPPEALAGCASCVIPVCRSGNVDPSLAGITFCAHARGVAGPVDVVTRAIPGGRPAAIVLEALRGIQIEFFLRLPALFEGGCTAYTHAECEGQELERLQAACAEGTPGSPNLSAGLCVGSACSMLDQPWALLLHLLDDPIRP